MVDLNRDNCGVCGGLFTIGDWASIVGDAWVHLRCKSEAERHEGGPCPKCDGTGDFKASYYPFPVMMCGYCYGFGIVSAEMAAEIEQEQPPQNLSVYK